jgi:sugar transferase (PEP-CTERM/EpsH1 system associated)
VRILFVTHRVPYPPTFGSKVRAFHMIRHLAQRHQVSVMSLARSDDEAREAQGLASHCHEFQQFRVHNAAQAAKMLATLPTPVSASEAFFHSGRMKRAVDRALHGRSFDFIVAHCSAVGRYVESAPLPKLMDLCDIDSRKWLDFAEVKPWPLSLGYRWEGRRVAAAELRQTRRFDRVTVATAGEAALLEGSSHAERVDWFANGVDLEYFRPPPKAADYDPNVIVFVGRMDYFPNEQCMVDFCAAVWPRLRKAKPALQLKIVGANPSARVKALAGIEGVSVTGAVADVRPHVCGAALTVAPLKIARGTQNKVLESMALGVPVVTSSMAAGGVDARAGEHLLVADTEDQQLEAILRVTGDSAERARLARAGRAQVEARHTWPNALERLDRIVAECMRSGRASAWPAQFA